MYVCKLCMYVIYLKQGKIGPRLLLITNGKLHMCFQVERPWMTLNGDYAFCFTIRVSFAAHHENLNEDTPVLSATEIYVRNFSFWHIRFICIYLWGFAGEGASHNSGVIETSNCQCFQSLYLQNLQR